jgi:hypothetical protein
MDFLLKKGWGKMKPKKGEFYRHFKGNIYQVLGYAKLEKTLEEMIIYKSFKDEIVWVRPLDEFVDIHPDHEINRFEKVNL